MLNGHSGSGFHCMKGYLIDDSSLAGRRDAAPSLWLTQFALM
jgi:hypothetical protein